MANYRMLTSFPFYCWSMLEYSQDVDIFHHSSSSEIPDVDNAYEGQGQKRRKCHEQRIYQLEQCLGFCTGT